MTYLIQTKNFNSYQGKQNYSHLIAFGVKDTDLFNVFNLSIQKEFKTLEVGILCNLNLSQGLAGESISSQTFGKLIITNCQINNSDNDIFASFVKTYPNFTIYLETSDQIWKNYAEREQVNGRRVVGLTLPVLYEEIVKSTLDDDRKFKLISGFMDRGGLSPLDASLQLFEMNPALLHKAYPRVDFQFALPVLYEGIMKSPLDEVKKAKILRVHLESKRISSEIALFQITNAGMNTELFIRLFPNAEVGLKVIKTKQQVEDTGRGVQEKIEGVSLNISKLIRVMMGMIDGLEDEQ